MAGGQCSQTLPVPELGVTMPWFFSIAVCPAQDRAAPEQRDGSEEASKVLLEPAGSVPAGEG